MIWTLALHCKRTSWEGNRWNIKSLARAKPWDAYRTTHGWVFLHKPDLKLLLRVWCPRNPALGESDRLSGSVMMQIHAKKLLHAKCTLGVNVTTILRNHIFIFHIEALLHLRWSDEMFKIWVKFSEKNQNHQLVYLVTSLSMKIMILNNRENSVFRAWSSSRSNHLHCKYCNPTFLYMLTVSGEGWLFILLYSLSLTAIISKISSVIHSLCFGWPFSEEHLNEDEERLNRLCADWLASFCDISEGYLHLLNRNGAASGSSLMGEMGFVIVEFLLSKLGDDGVMEVWAKVSSASIALHQLP